MYNVYLSKLFSRCYIFDYAMRLNKNNIVNLSGTNLFNLGNFNRLEIERRIEDSEIRYVNIVIDLDDNYFFKVLKLDKMVNYKLIIDILFNDKTIVIKSITINLKNNVSAVEFYILSNILNNKGIDLYINSVYINMDSIVKLLSLLSDLKYNINVLYIDYNTYKYIKNVTDNNLKEFVAYNINKYFIVLDNNIKYLKKYFYNDKVILYDMYDNINFIDNKIYLIKQIDINDFGNVKYNRFNDKYTLFGINLDTYLNKSLDIKNYDKFFIYCKYVIKNIEYYDNCIIIYYNDSITKLKYGKNFNNFIILNNSKRFLYYNFYVNRINVNYIQF